MAAVSATTESAAEDERSLDNDKVDGGSDRDNDDDSVVDEDDEEQGHQQKEKQRAVDAEMSEEDEKKEEPEEDEMEQEEDEEAEEDDADEEANEIVPDPVLSDLTAGTTKKTANRKRSRSSMDDDDDDLLPPIPSLRVTQRDRSLRSVPAILDQSKCVLLLEVLRLLDVHKTHRKDPLNRRGNWTALQRSFHKQPMGSRYRPSGNAGKFKKRIFKAFQYWKEWAQERGFDFVGLAPDPKDDPDRARAKEFVRLLYKIDAESKGEPVPDDIASGDEGGIDGGGGKKGSGRTSAAGSGGSAAGSTTVSRSGGDAPAVAAAAARRSPRRRSQHPQQQNNPPASVSDFSSAVSDLIRADEYAAASGATPEARRTALVGYYVAEAVAHQRAHTHLLREELRSHRAARDEEDIRRLEELQAKIDSYGVGGAGASAGGGGGGLGSGRGVPLHVYVELRDRCLARLSRSGREGADEADDHHRGGGGGEQITEAHV